MAVLWFDSFYVWKRVPYATRAQYVEIIIIIVMTTRRNNVIICPRARDGRVVVDSPLRRSVVAADRWRLPRDGVSTAVRRKSLSSASRTFVAVAPPTSRRYDFGRPTERPEWPATVCRSTEAAKAAMTKTRICRRPQIKCCTYIPWRRVVQLHQ